MFICILGMSNEVKYLIRYLVSIKSFRENYVRGRNSLSRKNFIFKFQCKKADKNIIG